MANSVKSGKKHEYGSLSCTLWLTSCFLLVLVDSDSCLTGAKPNELDKDCTAKKCEVNALRAEMKHCTSQVEKLSREFGEMKKELEAARKEVDTTQYALSEITSKLLANS